MNNAAAQILVTEALKFYFSQKFHSPNQTSTDGPIFLAKYLVGLHTPKSKAAGGIW